MRLSWLTLRYTGNRVRVLLSYKREGEVTALNIRVAGCARSYVQGL
jgi:hypothetical protein